MIGAVPSSCIYTVPHAKMAISGKIVRIFRLASMRTPLTKNGICAQKTPQRWFFFGPKLLINDFCLISAYIGAHEAKTVIRDDIVPDNMACGAYWAVLTGGNFARWTLHSAYNRV